LDSQTRVGAVGSLIDEWPEVWAGPECSFLTVAGWSCDQVRLTGHHRRTADIDRLADLGIRAMRFPVLWGRRGRRAEATDWSWAASRLDRLRQRAVEPVVGLLHHGFGPRGSDPLDPGWPQAFGQFAGEVARRFPDVRSYLPINEPLTTARFGGLYGWWPPYARDPDRFAALLLAQCRAFVEAARAIRSIRPDAVIVANEDIGRTIGSPGCVDVAERHRERRWLTFDLLSGRVDRFHPFRRALSIDRQATAALDLLTSEPGSPDVLGVDHYVTSDRFLDDRLDLYPPRTHAEEAGRRYADVELVRVAGFDVDGFRHAIHDTWDRYRLPIALTEVQLAGTPKDRVSWWTEAWSAAVAARAAGVMVRAVTAWSTFGSYDWESLLRDPKGIYEVGCFDASTAGTPRRTELATSVAVAARAEPDHEIGTDGGPGEGWWRQDERILFRPSIETA
jgi:dTDP-4-dehydrorhamnose reductase